MAFMNTVIEIEEKLDILSMEEFLEKVGKEVRVCFDDWQEKEKVKITIFHGMKE